MDAMQELALASGVALAGGLAGAIVSTILHRRAQAREARRLARLIAAGATRIGCSSTKKIME